MALILGILAGIFGLAIIILIIRLLFWMFKFLLSLAILVGMVYGGFKLVLFAWVHIGWWSVILIPILIYVLLILFGAIMILFQSPLEREIVSVFETLGMGTEEDILSRLNHSSNNSQAVREVINKFVENGKVEIIDFPGKPALYRWNQTNNDNDQEGVITHHINLD